MLAWVVGTSYGPVSVTSQYSIETAERIELVLGMEASFHLSYIVLRLERKFGYLQKKGTFLWNFVLNYGLGKLCFSISIVEMCYRLSSTTWTLRA